MSSNKTLSALVAVCAASFCLSTQAADATIAKDQAKDMKTQSEAQYQARKKVADANEDLNRADCKTALEGAAKRACEKSAKATAKSDKADAKTLHETEEQRIKDAKK